MHVQLPNNISDLSITFFAKGRPHEIQRSHKNFDLVRSTIIDWNKGERSDTDVESLITLADPKQALLVASGGRLEFQGNNIVYGGVALHNLWVDKILGFKDAGEDFAPIFLALEDLQKNPTPAARERLPIFVERSKLGFLPDGRIAAFKGVRDDFYDVHSGTVHYGIGKTVAMDRAACNANPDQTCSTGLHVGAIDYINNNGFGWQRGSDRRMLLTAFWPRHVVAVPTDYAGGKMRVEQLTVLDEVDKGYVTELLEKGTLMIRGYEIDTPAAEASAEPEAAKTDPSSPAGKAKVGDWIYVDGAENLDEGDYLVLAVEDTNGDAQRLTVKSGNDDDVERVDDDAVSRILDEAPIWARAKVGDWVITDSSDLPLFVTEVDDKDNYPDGSRLKLRDFDSEDWAENSEIEELLTSPPDVWLRVIEDDIVRIEGHALFRDGEYTISSIDTYNSKDADGDLYEIVAGEDSFSIQNDVIKSIKREEEEAAAIGAAAAVAAEAAKPVFERAKVGDTVRVLKGTDHEAGDFRVVKVREGDSRHRLAVAYRSYDRWWIANELITEIVTADATTVVAPVVPAEPAWKRAKVGDTVKIEGTTRFPKSAYVVDQVDASNGMDRRLRLDNPGGAKWVDNRYVKDIVTAETPVAAPVADIRPIWEQVLAGDKVRIEGDPDVRDGDYTVQLTDSSLTGGPGGVGVRLNREGYVYNKTVKAILERDGKPFGVPAVAKITGPDAYKQAKVGDQVVVKAGRDHTAGTFKVTMVNDSSGYNRLAVDYEGKNGAVWWIRNEHVLEAIPALAKAA
jgi:hypothetical protein